MPARDRPIFVAVFKRYAQSIGDAFAVFQFSHLVSGW